MRRGDYPCVVLEIGAESHYHSDLTPRRAQAGPRKQLQNQVITNMKIVASAATLLLAAALFAQPAHAQGDPEAGREIGYTCLGCHGIEGYRNAYPSFRVPKLGGQKAGYIEIALRGYRDGTRKHPTMIAQATSLTDKEIADVSAYLATLGADTVASGGSSPAPFDKAAACVACHGQNGISVNAAWPTLAGQWEDYLLNALKQYRAGTRKDPVMTAQAQLIAEEDLEKLALYFSRLDGLETTEPE